MEDKEWNELVALKQELDNNMMAFDSYAHEKFTELFVKSLEGKGDSPVFETTR